MARAEGDEAAPAPRWRLSLRSALLIVAASALACAVLALVGRHEAASYARAWRDYHAGLAGQYESDAREARMNARLSTPRRDRAGFEHSPGSWARRAAMYERKAREHWAKADRPRPSK